MIRHNNKQIDLSRTIRLSGLAPGAKLELVQLSKSAGVVSVALQLPASGAPSPAQPRITDKFPSTTTLWLLLRKFEAGVAGSSEKLNLTAKGAPSTGSGAGRLYYSQPVLTIMNREMSTFTDLQKTLAQLGFNSGSVLIKLDYRTSETPLEEAMVQIQAYFDEVDPRSSQPTASSAVAPETTEPKQEEVKPEWLQDNQMDGIQQTSNSQQPESSASGQVEVEPTNHQVVESPDAPNATVSDRPVSVYRPPLSVGPAPVRHNEADYVPTVEHAQIHQKLLQQESRNRRLPTDAELLAKQKEQQEELAKIENVEIKIRFPDQSAVSSKFAQQDTAASLYQFVRDCLEDSIKTEAFILRNPGVRDKTGGAIADNAKKLIFDLQLRGRVLVVFGWDGAKASQSTRSIKQVLKPELRQQAREYVPPEIPSTPAEVDDSGVKIDLGSKKTEDDGGVKAKMPKWLKGLGKK